jgi:hypothetical protein
MPEWEGITSDILNHYGFVYKITNIKNGKYYIGKKFLWNQIVTTRVRKPTKVERDRLLRYQKTDKKKYLAYKDKLKIKYSGKNIRSRGLKESDWRLYWGSSESLLTDINKYGYHNFKREIIRYCEDKWECAYYELIEQIKYGVLMDINSYNRIIAVKLGKRVRYE